jgi:hypothetical protein
MNRIIKGTLKILVVCVIISILYVINYSNSNKINTFGHDFERYYEYGNLTEYYINYSQMCYNNNIELSRELERCWNFTCAETDKYNITVTYEGLLPYLSFEDYEFYVKEYAEYENVVLEKGYSKDKELIKLAKELRGADIVSTVNNISLYIWNKQDYSFSDSKRKAEDLIKSSNMDCTDFAELFYHLLGLNGIYSRRVHGFDEAGGKHDWLEVLYPTYDGYLYWKPFYEGEVKSGAGFW